MFLFRFQMRDFFAISGITKLWGMEIQKQVPAPPSQPPSLIPSTAAPIQPPSIDPMSKYLLQLSSYLIPRTKALLQVLSGTGRSFTLAEFAIRAKQLGVPHDNVEMTLAALLESGCLAKDEASGVFQVSEFGRSFLQFEMSLKL
jgi:hypothetical protein